MGLDLDTLVIGPCVQVWGIPVTFMPARGLPQAGIVARFEEKFREQMFVDGNEIALGKPMLGIQQSQFTQQPVKGDVFQINGRLWQVLVVLPDGNGHAHVRLDLANDAQYAVAPVPAPYTPS
jgi:hypothetical protein